MKVNLTKQHDLIPMLMSGLRTQAVSMKFTKADGSIRDMTATLSPHLIPDEYTPKHSEVSEECEEHPSFARVFDVNALGWRTVKFASVLEFDAV